MKLILLVVAIILFVLAAAGVPGRLGWGWLGMAFFASSFVIS
jgi:hypothetical protein